MPDHLPLLGVDRRRHPWFVAGGVALAAVAGYVNLVMLGFFHVPVSHMTGAVSRVAADLAEGDRPHLQIVIGIVTGFLVGAATSGALIGSRRLESGRRYGVALMLEGVLLSGACLLGLRESQWAVPVAATACGLQNAMASSYHGLVVRTTHVTGLVTDLGLLLGHALRDRSVEGWRVAMLSGLLAGFTAGALAGAYANAWIGVAALWPAAVACLAAGAAYFLHRERVRRRAAAAS